MIVGLGLDLIEVARIKKSLGRERFAQYCFSQRELRAYDRLAQSDTKLAGCFAAKEALGKALGTGVRGFAMNEVSVLRDQLGKPYFSFSGAAAGIIEGMKARAFVSITNTGGFAAAVVVLEVD